MLTSVKLWWQLRTIPRRTRILFALSRGAMTGLELDHVMHVGWGLYAELTALEDAELVKFDLDTIYWALTRDGELEAVLCQLSDDGHWAALQALFPSPELLRVKDTSAITRILHAAQRPTYVLDICSRYQLDAGHVYALLAKLEKSGLVTYERKGEDRAVYRLSLAGEHHLAKTNLRRSQDWAVLEHALMPPT